MKKLMIALTAVAAAFAARADVTSIADESFNDWEAVTGHDAWTALGDTALITDAPYVVSYADAGQPNVQREQGKGEGKNLAVKTPLATPMYYSLAAPTNMEGGVYFDSVVKFTACDTDAEIPAGSDAKIMVWTKEIVDSGDNVTGTNLMVTAGYFSDTEGAIVAKTYECGSITKYGVATDGSDWCRLTIKAIKNISATATDTVPAFQVFVNAQPVTTTVVVGGDNQKIGVDGSVVDNLNMVCNEMAKNFALFPSMVAGDAEISKVGFAGQGGIDDVAFLTGTPTDGAGNAFAADPVPVIATVGEVNCETLEQINAAILNATSGATVTLWYDVTGDLTFGVDATFVLALNGKTLTGAINQTAGTLTINGEGKVTGAVTCQGGTINGGTFDGVVHAGRGGNLAINGGLFSIAAGNTATSVGTVKTGYKLEDNGAGYLAVVEITEDGSAEKPWKINGVDDLIGAKSKIVLGTAGAGVHYKQMADIALTGEWTGIGAFDAKDNLGNSETYISGAFQGTYDGDNHTISGLVLQRGDYVGFFGSTYEATIKNLKISLGNATGWGETSTKAETMSNYGGAVFVGVSVKSTIENCETLAVGENTAITATKALAGIVGFAAAGTTVKGCVNNLAITTANEKSGGIISITQQGNAAYGSTAVVVDSCTNHGAVACTTAGKFYAAGIFSYVNFATTFKGANVNTATVTLQDGTAGSSICSATGVVPLIDEGATFEAPAGYKAYYHDATPSPADGLMFATVSDGVATLVKNAALAAGNTYKVMAAGAAPTIELAAGEWIKFDTSLIGLASDAGITTVSGYKVTPAPVGNVTTYTSEAATPIVPPEQGEIVVTNGVVVVIPEAGVKDVEISNVGTNTVAIPASIDTIKGVPVDQLKVGVTVGEKAYDITAAFNKSGTAETGVTIALNPEAKVTVDGVEVPVTPTIAEDSTAPIAEGAVETKAIPGLTYTLQRQTTLGGEKTQADSKSATSNSISLKDGISGDKPKSAFYTIEVSK